MNTISPILKQLENTSGKNAKVGILMNAKSDPVVKFFFFSCLDSVINFYVAKRPAGAKTGKTATIEILAAMQLLHENLASRKLTGHDARDFLIDLYSKLDEDGGVIIDRILERDPDCGVGAGTVNKVWPGMVLEWPVMAASAEDDAPEQIFPAIVQEKSDGMRMEAVVDVANFTVEYRSARSGKVMTFADYSDSSNIHLDLLDLVADAHDMYGLPTKCVIDGEVVVVHDADDVATPATILPRASGNGLIGKSVKGTCTNPKESARFRFVVWDIIPFDKFLEGTYNVSIEERTNVLKRLIQSSPTDGVSAIDSKYKYISHSLSILCESAGPAKAMYDEIVARKGEGILVKTCGKGWENRRSKYYIKMKDFNDADLRIVGLEESKKVPGTMGAALVEDASGKVTGEVGTGWSKKEREDYWNNPSLIMNKILATQYAYVIQDKKRPGVFSLYSPSVIELRVDKTEPDDLSKYTK